MSNLVMSDLGLDCDVHFTSPMIHYKNHKMDHLLIKLVSCSPSSDKVLSDLSGSQDTSPFQKEYVTLFHLSVRATAFCHLEKSISSINAP